MCGFIAQLVEQRTGNAEVTGSNPVEALIFFRLLLSNCLNWKIYCDDHSSLSLLSMSCKNRYRLIPHEDAKLQSAGHSYSFRSLEYSHALPTAITDYYKYSLYPRTITEWNKLPRKIELSNSLAAFKNAVSNIY